MVKFLYSFNWNIDARLKDNYFAKKIETFPLVSNQYGKISAVENPYDVYTTGYTSMLQVKLNKESIDVLFKDINLAICGIEEVNFIVGFCGLLTIELYGTILRDDEPCIIRSELYKSDLILLANYLPTRVEFVSEILKPLQEFLDIDNNYYYGLPISLVNKGLCNPSESYIYTYHMFSENENELNEFREIMHVEGDYISVNNNKVWMNFANYLWKTDTPPCSELAHWLSYASIPAAWEVLVYDVGAINCRNLLKLINQNIPFDYRIMRNMINRDNLILQEICISKREQTTEQHKLTLRSVSEFGSKERGDLFFRCQEMLKYAIKGIDVRTQVRSSRVVEIVLSVLTAMSAYSVANDIYALVTGKEEVISFHFLSTLLLSIATIIMAVVLFNIIRENIE